MQYRITLKRGAGMVQDVTWLRLTLEGVTELLASLYLVVGDTITVEVEKG